MINVFDKPRLGVYDDKGLFVEAPTDPGSRWVGGVHDAKLAKCVLAMLTGGSATEVLRAFGKHSTADYLCRMQGNVFEQRAEFEQWIVQRTRERNHYPHVPDAELVAKHPNGNYLVFEQEWQAWYGARR